MHSKVFLVVLILPLLLSVVFSASFTKPIISESLTSLESEIVGLVNGTSAYNYDLELEKIALNHTLSHYSFRAAGSSGANATADWIMEQFESFGLEAYKESFQFTTWDLLSKPTLIIDDDGDPSTTSDQTTINSFQSEHYSWPTPQNGVFADLVILPLPPAANYYELGINPINTAEWNAINTTGKIVLIGREVRWSYQWQTTYKNKLSAQTPAAVIYTWWHDWMSFAPDFFSSGGGYPLSPFGPYYWNLEIPVGFVNYNDGLWIRNRESSLDVSAKVKIESIIGEGPHYNVVGKLTGYKYPNKFVIVSSHYDTIMSTGFCDNGAGTAGVIELARIFSEANKSGLLHSKYTILFIPFASEELGLLGSIDYVTQHKAETGNIVAVINLDCIGSDDLYITETNPAGEIDLDELVRKAAEYLGMTAMVEPPGGSDHEVFRDPASFGIEDATPVESSILLISYPLLYNDKWSMGTPGWIHTSYDYSTSTTTMNWVEATDLENHLKVAALSIMRIVYLVGDVNFDSIVDISDVVIVVNAIPSYQGSLPPDYEEWNLHADIDGNNLVDLVDLVLVIDAVRH